MAKDNKTRSVGSSVKTNLGSTAISSDILETANIGLWAFELDEGKEPRMYVDDTMLGLIGLNKQTTPEKTYHAWYDHIDPDHYDEVAQSVEKMTAGIHAEVQYPWHHPDGYTMIVRCGGVRNPAYTQGVRIEGTHMDVTEVMHFEKEETAVANLQADALNYISDNDCTPEEFLDYFADKILSITNSEQVIFRGPDGLRIVKNAPGVPDVIQDVCKKCVFSDFTGDVYENGVVEMTDYNVGYKGNMPQKGCPVKSGLMHRVYSDGELAGLLTVHYITEKHFFSDVERRIWDMLANVLGLALSKVNRKAEELELSHRLEAELEHAKLRADLLSYASSYDGDPIDLLKHFAERLRILIGCDQVIYRDLHETRVMVNSPEIEPLWAVPIEYCQQCEHFDANHHMYRNGVTEMSDCAQGFEGIPTYHDCPIKSSLTRIIYLDGKADGYLAIRYVVNYHEFTQLERDTLEELAKVLSLSLSRYVARTRNVELQKEVDLKKEIEQNLQMVDALANEYTSVYYINLEDDTLIPYSMNEATKGEFGETFNSGISYTDAFTMYSERVGYAQDKDKLLNAGSIANIKKQLRNKKTYRETYRTAFYGEPEYREMTFVKVGDENNEPKAVVLGFSDKNAEIVDHLIGTLFYDDYAAIYTVDLDNDYITGIKASGVYDVFDETRESHTLTSKYMKWEEFVDDDAKDFFINFSNPEYVREYIGNSDRKEYIYHSTVLDHWFRFECRVLERDENNIASKVVLTQHIIDDDYAEKMELQNQFFEQSSMTKILLSDYEHALYVRTGATRKDDVTTVLIESKYLVTTVPELANSTSFSKQLKYYVDNLVHPDDREMFREKTSRERILRGIHSQLFYIVDFRTIEDGVLHYAQMRFANVTDETGDYGFVIGLRKIDEEKKAENTLKEALTMAQSANRAKTTFLNNMSHDIRTPMNAIIGYTGLAASHIDNQELLKDYLTKIGQSSDHLLSLINDVLDMSRIEPGKMNLNEKNENISEIVHTLRSIVQADIKSKQLDFYIDSVDVTDENIVCDKLRLNQVLLNILSNSIKYTPAGGTVSLRITEKGVGKNGYGSYEFIIKDNGIGMSEEFLKTIFDPFTRVKSTTVSGIQGTGLGMSITKNIVDMMGGTIGIKSKENEGTEVTISFDFKLAEAKKQVTRIPKLEGLRGLVVDDDSNTCISIQRMLKDVGMRAEWCVSGKEAVIRTEAALQDQDLFKVYIIDWLMPDMNGIETARRIRKVVGKESPIIILTAYDWSDIEEEAVEAGVTAFVSKPMFPSDLHNVLEKCCGDGKTEKKKKETNYNFEGKKILLVEDNEMNREIAEEILTEAGFVVDTAEDGDIAVDMVDKSIKKNKKCEYDLILMDIQMPRMDGYKATRAIRNLPHKGDHVPIIAMTANAFEEDRKMALDSGMDEHIAKPIDVKKLKKTLAKYLK